MSTATTTPNADARAAVAVLESEVTALKNRISVIDSNLVENEARQLVCLDGELPGVLRERDALRVARTRIESNEIAPKAAELDRLWRKIRTDEKRELEEAPLRRIAELRKQTLAAIDRLSRDINGNPDLKAITAALEELNKARRVRGDRFPVPAVGLEAQSAYRDVTAQFWAKLGEPLRKLIAL